MNSRSLARALLVAALAAGPAFALEMPSRTAPGSRPRAENTAAHSGSSAADMHPTDEHLLPFFVAAGAAGRQPTTRIHASLTYGDLGMDAYAFGPGAARLGPTKD